MANWGSQGSNDRETEYGTPGWFIDPIKKAVGGFDLDPASGAEAVDHADVQYTEEEDGLVQDWFGTVWCNPPFSDKADWIEKAYEEYNRGNAELILLLLPVDTSAGWFHEYVVRADAIWFKKGRLSFDGSDNWSPNFGVMLAIFGDYSEDLSQILSHRGILIEEGTWHGATEKQLTEYAEGKA